MKTTGWNSRHVLIALGAIGGCTARAVLLLLVRRRCGIVRLGVDIDDA